MAWVKIRVPRTSQPQDACGIDWNNPIARGLICLLIDAGSSKLDLVKNNFAARSNPHNALFKTVKDFSSVEYSNSWDSFPVNASGLTQFSAACLAVKTDASSYVVGGPFGASQSGETLRAFSVESGNGFPSSSTYYSLWSDGGSRYNIFASETPLTPKFSPQVLMMTLANSTAKAYSNGALVGSGAGPATLQTIYSLAAGSNTGIVGNFWGGIVPITAIWDRELTTAEAKSFADNPWQIFEPEEITIWVPDAVGAGGTDHLVTPANSQQINIASTGAITQTHLIGAAHSTQANVGTAGSVSQGSITQVTSANSTQPNTASAGSIAQTHQVGAASSSTGHTGTAAAVSQTHLISAASSQQANTATAGAVSQSGAQTVSAADSVQANTASAGGISQTHLIVCAPVAVDSVASASSIVQTHLIGAANSAQGNSATAGGVTSSAPGAAVWPLASQVLAGVVYGPTGVEYTGTYASGSGPSAADIAAAVWSYAP